MEKLHIGAFVLSKYLALCARCWTWSCQKKFWQIGYVEKWWFIELNMLHLKHLQFQKLIPK